MVSTEHGRNGDVDARLGALRAGAEGLVAPRPGNGTSTSGRPTPPDHRWLRTRRVASLTAIVVLVAAVSFSAGWIAATLQMSPTPAPQATGPAQPVGVPAPAAPTSGSRSPLYTYAVQSNYPVSLGYVGVNGDQVNQDAVTTPWSLQVTTSGWGADADATVYASASTDRGDAYVSCTITDASGKVVASDREDSADPWARCDFG